MGIRARAFGTSNPEYADAQAGFALALAKLGDRESALRNAVTAEATGRDHLRMMLRSLPERQALNYVAVRPRGLDLILSLVGSSPEATAFAIDGLIRSRALVLDEMAARQRSRRGAIEGTDPLRTAFASAQQRLANLVVRGPDQLSPAQYAALLEDARRESETAEQALAEQSAEFRAERSRAQLGLDELHTSLPVDSALVSFVRYERTFFSEPLKNYTPRGPARSSSRTVPSYLALVLRAHQTPIVVPLGPAHTIDSLVSQWRADIAAEGGASTQNQPGGSVRSSRVSGTALRKIVWDPLAAQLGDVSRVFIVPDGTLSLVPFVALPVGQRSYLLESAPVLHYLSAERDLVPTTEDAPSGQGLLAIGGPAFDDPTLFGGARSRPGAGSVGTQERSNAVLRSAGSACATVQGVKFSPLAGTLQEVRELSGMWSASAMSNDKGSRVLVGRDASEPAFKKEAHGYRVLHVATHGFFLGDTCAPALPGTRSVGGLVNASGSQPAGMRAENPLLLSGLALAGANRRQAAAADEDDGILTAEEVASLDLGGVEWAVLSACDTGVGQIKTGEGVFGLRRAFQVAGARTVIMSLWSVDDQATRVWMRALYEGRFQKQLTTADAMHAASIAVLQSRRAKGQSASPFYWAAFVAVGNWN
jgi:CHAT domain-containing protein